MTKNILILPGDGIGPEVIEQAVRVLKFIDTKFNLNLHYSYDAIGGDSIDRYGVPLTYEVINLAKDADAVLLGSVGGYKWDEIEPHLRPEQGLLQIRKELGLYANLRPIKLYSQLAQFSSIKPEYIAELDLLIIRELTSGIYFGNHTTYVSNNKRIAIDELKYSEDEIKNILTVAFKASMQRSKKLCSVDKANVLDSSRLWRSIACELHAQYPQVELVHMYVDNAAMQLVKNPKQFDVIVTENMFGDILSDQASVLTGSIGMLPSASLGDKVALYEPAGGSAPDIAGKNIANPFAAILSVAMMLKYSFNMCQYADLIEQAVIKTIENKELTADLSNSTNVARTSDIGDYVISYMSVQS